MAVASPAVQALIISPLESIALPGLAFCLSCPSSHLSLILPTAATICFPKRIWPCHHSDGGFVTCVKSKCLGTSVLHQCPPFSLTLAHQIRQVSEMTPLWSPHLSYFSAKCAVLSPGFRVGCHPFFQGLTHKPLELRKLSSYGEVNYQGKKNSCKTQ